MTLILFSFAIVICQGASAYRMSIDDGVLGASTSTELVLRWGGMRRSMYTLFLSVTGGVSWGDVFDSVQEVGSVYAAVFIIYIFFMFFSVLNIVTAVTVDSAIQMNNQDRAVRAEQELQNQKRFLADLYELLDQLCEATTGCISAEQFSVCMEDPKVATNLDMMGVDTSNVDLLFAILDINSDGDISVVELINGLQRLHGTASKLDIHGVSNLVNMVAKQTGEIYAFLQGE